MKFIIPNTPKSVIDTLQLDCSTSCLVPGTEQDIEIVLPHLEDFYYQVLTKRDIGKPQASDERKYLRRVIDSFTGGTYPKLVFQPVVEA